MHKYGTFIAVALLVVVGAGCAALRGASDEDMVMNAVTQWQAGFNDRDGEVVVEVLSEDYYDERGLTRDSFGDIMPELDSYGVGQVDISELTVAVEGETATAGPVSLDMGGSDVEFEISLQKEDDGVWRIVSLAGGE